MKKSGENIWKEGKNWSIFAPAFEVKFSVALGIAEKFFEDMDVKTRSVF